MFLDWKNEYCENDYTTQSNLGIQCNPCQTTNDIFHRTRTKKFYDLYGNTKDLKLIFKKQNQHSVCQYQTACDTCGFKNVPLK